MTRIVLDASAVLAVLYREPGAELVVVMLADGDIVPLISTVNFSEVYARLLRDGMEEHEAATYLNSLKLNVISFEEADAYATARLQKLTSSQGLSFGDRACLSLAAAEKATAWTADKAWKKVKTGAAVELIRI